jgi:predicted phage replisome organizer
MRERKYVKFRVDMYDDTKFKIIDMKPERDVIHYIWSRMVLLAGKVNLEGDLYLSKSIPYTIETLAIEFNRDIAVIKSALDLFIELEMVEFTEDKIYRVKNFAKHQNIKVKEKENLKNKEENIKNINVPLNESSKVEVNGDKDKKSDNSLKDEESRDNLQMNLPISLNFNKGKKKNKKQKDDLLEIIDPVEEVKDDSINGFSEGVRPLMKGESVISAWSFG